MCVLLSDLRLETAKANECECGGSQERHSSHAVRRLQWRPKPYPRRAAASNGREGMQAGDISHLVSTSGCPLSSSASTANYSNDERPNAKWTRRPIQFSYCFPSGIEGLEIKIAMISIVPVVQPQSAMHSVLG